MSASRFWGVLENFAEDGTAIADSVTETVIFRNVPIAGQTMHHHRFLLCRYFGKLSTTGTPTLIFRIRWGGVSGTLIGLTETLTMGSGVATVNWLLEAMIQSRSDGATGSLLCHGKVSVHSAAGTVLDNVFSVSGYDAPAAVTCDLQAAADLAVTAQWGTQSASNTLTGMSGYVALGN